MSAAYIRPTPVSMPYAIRPGAVSICRLDGVELETCQAADSEGHCPRPRADGTVPCAGRVLVLPVLIRGSRAWHIPAGYHTCFLGSYGVYRQRG